MSEIKRKRGRPLGSGKDDSATLRKIADKMAANPSLKPTTAIKSVICADNARPIGDEALIRRLQEKWKANGQGLLAEAQVRRRKPREVPRHYGGGRTVLEQLDTYSRAIKGFENSVAQSAALKAALATLNSPALKAMTAYEAPAILRAMEEHDRFSKMLGGQSLVAEMALKAITRKYW